MYTLYNAIIFVLMKLEIVPHFGHLPSQVALDVLIWSLWWFWRLNENVFVIY